MGPEFGKFVACEKGKEFVDKKVAEIKNVVMSKSDELKHQTLNQIASQETEAHNKIKNAVAEIDK